MDNATFYQLLASPFKKYSNWNNKNFYVWIPEVLISYSSAWIATFLSNVNFYYEFYAANTPRLERIRKNGG